MNRKQALNAADRRVLSSKMQRKLKLSAKSRAITVSLLEIWDPGFQAAGTDHFLEHAACGVIDDRNPFSSQHNVALPADKEKRRRRIESFRFDGLLTIGITISPESHALALRERKKSAFDGLWPTSETSCLPLASSSCRCARDTEQSDMAPGCRPIYNSVSLENAGRNDRRSQASPHAGP